MEYVSPQYQEQLKDLATLLCKPIGHTAVSPDFFGDMHEHEAPTNQWDEVPGGRWDSLGCYYVQDEL